MKKMLALLLIIDVIIGTSYHSANAQIYKFQQYSKEKGGVCHNFINSIVQDKHGFIWFSTGMGLCRFDGFQFTPANSSDLPLENVNTSFRDSNGNVWFGYINGLTVKYNGINFSIADTSVTKTVVAQIVQAPEKGEIVIATQSGGITRIFDKKIERIEECFNSIIITSMCFADNDKLLVGSFDGLYLYSYGAEPQDLALLRQNEELSYLSIASIIPKVNGSGFWVATVDDGIFSVVLNDDGFETERLDIPEIDYTHVQSVYEDSQNNLWISTFGAGLIRITVSPELKLLKTNVYNSENGMTSDNVKQAYFDNQQNLWVATYGKGVASITNLAFSFFDGLKPIEDNATALLSIDDSEYWIAGTGTIIRFNSTQEPKITLFGRDNDIPNDKITALGANEDGELWIGTAHSGLYKMAKNTKHAKRFYIEENSLSNAIQKFVFDDENIWMATRNGVIVLNSHTGEKKKHYTMFDGGLPHNFVKDIFKDSKGRIWIATNSNSLVDVKNNSRLYLEDDTEIAEFSAITEDSLGRIWAGTNGKGVYAFDENRDTIYHFTSSDGLKSDYCYAITFDSNSQIWTGHRMGLSNININKFSINTLGEDNGIYGDVNELAMILNESGEMLIGMTDGVMMYEVNADRAKEQKPMLNLIQVYFNDEPYNPNIPIVLPYKRHKLQFDFVGLQYSDPNSVSYQYWLDGYDTEWSKSSKSTTAMYSRVLDGKYNFWVKACNNNNCTKETILFSFTVRKPFFKTWWFVLLVIGSVIGLGYSIITIRDRNHKILQQYLENELNMRTKEVFKQKEEIEIKNKDITDSINYAKRIQFSVLPSKSTLTDHCSDAFIFYQPRDIVSGDFYWFDYFPHNKQLLIVCADSTGHGVPGAFMSLIGTTLIKDITNKPDIKNPSDILYKLDNNIQTTLNSNRDSEHADDGMDLVVFDINTETYFTRIASAMRPYIIYHEGKPAVHKYSHASIGGHYIENKSFTTSELQLAKGDLIYMFTDGYADQFGGPAGKRFKMNRLLTIIEDMHKRSMDEQYRVIKQNFDLWKGDNEQIDDVLLIGVRL